MTQFTSTSGLVESTRTREIRERIEAEAAGRPMDPNATGSLVWVQLYRASLLQDCIEQLTAAGHIEARGEVGATASPRAQRVPPPPDSPGNARVTRGASRVIQKRRPRR